MAWTHQNLLMTFIMSLRLDQNTISPQSCQNNILMGASFVSFIDGEGEELEDGEEEDITAELMVPSVWII